jgi:hypothetical protein
MTFPPAWYPDPTGTHDHRWWDGIEWTAHVADGGVASLDEVADALARPPAALPAADPSATPGGGADATGVMGADARRDRVGTASLVLGLVALPLALLPFLGLIVAGIALALALIARRRARAERRAIPGVTTGGLATGAGAVALALIVTWSALSFLTSGDNLRAVSAIMRDYVACTEERTATECRRELEQALAALGEG